MGADEVAAHKENRSPVIYSLFIKADWLLTTGSLAGVGGELVCYSVKGSP